MKRIMIGCALFLSIMPGMLQSDAVNKLAQGLWKIDQEKELPVSGTGDEGRDLPKIKETPKEFTPEQIAAQRKEALQERIKKIREKSNKNELKTPGEAADALVSYLAAQFELLFGKLADRIGDAIETTFGDKTAAAAMRKIPGALADGALLANYMIKQVSNRAYLRNLVKVREGAKCLLAKDSTARANMTDANNKFICQDMKTAKDALLQVLENMQAFMVPILSPVILGVEISGNKVEGLLVQSTNIIAPEITKDVKTIVDLVDLIISLASQSEKALKYEAAPSAT